jgi:uncharacterized protein YuzE
MWSSGSYSPTNDHHEHTWERGRNHSVRITYDHDADAAYIDLSGATQPGSGWRGHCGRTSIQAVTPPGVPGFVVLDWNDDRLVGIEILDASSRLHHDNLGQADDIS